MKNKRENQGRIEGIRKTDRKKGESGGLRGKPRIEGLGDWK